MIILTAKSNGLISVFTLLSGYIGPLCPLSSLHRACKIFSPDFSTIPLILSFSSLPNFEGFLVQPISLWGSPGVLLIHPVLWHLILYKQKLSERRWWSLELTLTHCKTWNTLGWKQLLSSYNKPNHLESFITLHCICLFYGIYHINFFIILNPYILTH